MEFAPFGNKVKTVPKRFWKGLKKLETTAKFQLTSWLFGCGRG